MNKLIIYFVYEMIWLSAGAPKNGQKKMLNLSFIDRC